MYNNYPGFIFTSLAFARALSCKHRIVMLSPFFKSTSPPGLSQLNVSLFGWSYLKTLVLVMKSLSLARSQPRASVAPGRIGYILSAKLKRTIIGVATNNIITANDIMIHIDTNTY